MKLRAVLGGFSAVVLGSVAAVGCESEGGAGGLGFDLPDFDGGGFSPDGAPPGTAPIDTTLTARPDAVTNKTEARFEFSASRPGKFACRVDGQPPAECSSPFSITVTEGLHSFEVAAFASDGAADLTPEKYEWTVDLTKPKTTITKAPASLDNSKSAVFEFTANENASFRCTVDTGAPGPCTSPFVTGTLADGSHTFTVVAIDAAGNAESPGATTTWTIDTSLPDTTIDSGPTGLVTSASSNFTFSSPAGGSVTFECAVDGAAFAPCTSPQTVTSASDGPRTFRVRARTATGNVDPTPAERSWTVDTTPPTVSITGGPNGPTNLTAPSFTFATGTGATATECRTDANQFVACTSPFSTGTLAQGPHTFEVRARDLAGNTATDTRAFTVDSVVPALAITSGPNGPTNVAAPTFGFTAEPGATVTCRVDGGAYVPCNATYTTPSLVEGPHTFDVRAVDAAGNSATANRAFTVDTVTPIVNILTGPSGPTNLTSGTFTFSVSESTTNLCRVTGGAFTACTTSFNYGPLGNGGFTFEVQASDAAGNVGTQSRAFTVDTVAPTVAFTSGPSGATNITSPSFGFTTGGATGTRCRVDLGAFAPCTSPYAPGSFTGGTHTVYVEAFDAAGNTAQVSRSFTIDTTPPAVNITSGPTSIIAGGQTTFQFTRELGSTTQCRVYPQGNPSGAYTTCNSPYVFTAPVQTGTWVFEVRATDAAGNSASDTQTFGVYIIG